MLLLTAMLGLTVPHLLAAERPNINITGYVIDAQLDPADHTLKATARVTFTATDTVSAAIFELHNALKVDSVTDEQHHQLSGERGPNATISVALPSPMSKGATPPSRSSMEEPSAEVKRARWKDSRWRRSAIPSATCCMPAVGSPWSAT